MPGNEIQSLGIDDREVTLSENTTGQFSAVIDIEVPKGYRYVFPGGEPVEMFIPVHESQTVTTDNGTETVNLSNDLVDSPSVRNVPTSSSETATSGHYDLVVWDDTLGDQTGVASVDYSGNSFDYTTGDTTDDDLNFWYLWGDSSQVEFRHYTPDEEEYEKELSTSMRRMHKSSTFSRTGYVTYDNQFTMLEKEHLKVHIKTDVDLTDWGVYDASADNWVDSTSPGTTDTYSYADFSFPVKRVPMRR